MTESAAPRSKAWRWGVCILLLAATMINYMDRQTLSATAKRVKTEFQLSNQQYGKLEKGFSYAFAAGGLLFGILADRVNVRFLYPALLVAWSLVGFLTGLSRTYGELLICRTALGLFEAGHWPCALSTIPRILERKDRTMGNSLLQSGGALGAIITPLVIQRMLDSGVSWRTPYLIIGAAGSLWAVLWLAVIRTRDLKAAPPEDTTMPGSKAVEDIPFHKILVSPRFLSLVIMVSLINTCWQVIRAWLTLFLQEGRGYTEAQANYFNSAYNVATDIGVLTGGVISLRLIRGGLSVHAARCWIFLGGAMLALLAVAAARVPAGPLLLGLLLLVGAGTLAVFPCYYAFTQELSLKHQGKVTGSLSICGWIVTANVQDWVGRVIDRTHSYDGVLTMAGLAPLVSLIILMVLWNRGAQRRLA